MCETGLKLDKKKEKNLSSPGVCHHVFRAWKICAFIIWSVINIHTKTHTLKLNEVVIVIFSIMDVGNKKIPRKRIDAIGVIVVPFFLFIPPFQELMGNGNGKSSRI